MRPHDRVLVSSAIKLFDASGVYLGGQLLIADMVKDWHATGFREEDLKQALNCGAEWGVFAVSNSEWGPVAKLLSSNIPPLPDQHKHFAAKIRERTKDQLRILRATRRKQQAGQRHARSTDQATG